MKVMSIESILEMTSTFFQSETKANFICTVLRINKNSKMRISLKIFLERWAHQS